MENFSYYNPVNVVFGKGSISELNTLISPTSRIMLIYGGGSIKRNGIYEQVTEALSGFTLFEFAGIEPNPKYETCMKAVEAVKNNQADFLLSVGGGSTLDATKFIAAAVKYPGEDPWEILAETAPVETALPLGCVLTLPATGSEMNTNSVVSRESTGEKLHFSSPLVYPKFSILDPEATYSLPKRQTINGIVDAYVHVMEQYMTFDVNTPLQDRQSEAIIATLIEEAPKVLANPENYEARANVMWSATNALNGSLACGVIQDWGTHMLGHELTAAYGLDHAQTLAIVMPALWRYKKADKQQKLLQYGQRIFGLDPKAENAVENVISKTENFFHSIGMKTKLSDYGIDAQEAAILVKNRLEKRRAPLFGEHQDIDSKAACEILRNC
jgi:NADP-dependent alcohol dehydrogenase